MFSKTKKHENQITMESVVASPLDILPEELVQYILSKIADHVAITNFGKTSKTNLAIVKNLLDHWYNKSKINFPFNADKIVLKEYLDKKHDTALEQMSKEELAAYASLHLEDCNRRELAYYILRLKDVKKLDPAHLFNAIELVLTIPDEERPPKTKLNDSITDLTSSQSATRFIIMLYFIHFYKITTLKDKELFDYLEDFHSKSQKWIDKLSSYILPVFLKKKLAGICFKLTPLISNRWNISFELYLEEIRDEIKNLLSEVTEYFYKNLAGIELNDYPFKNHYLFNFNLSDAILSGDLTSLRFFNSNLTNTDFSNSHLEKATISGCLLKNTNLSDAKLNGASFEENTIQECNFKDAQFGPECEIDEKTGHIKFNVIGIPEIKYVATNFKYDNKIKDCQFDENIIFADIHLNLWIQIFFPEQAFQDVSAFQKALEKIIRHQTESLKTSDYNKRELLDMLVDTLKLINISGDLKLQMLRVIKKSEWFKKYFGKFKAFFTKLDNDENQVKNNFLAYEKSLKTMLKKEIVTNAKMEKRARK